MSGRSSPAPDPVADITAFHDLVDALPAIVWLCDAQGGCLWINRHWSEVTGQEQASALGDGWLEAVHPDDRPRLRPAQVAVLIARGVAFACECRLRVAGSGWRWFLARAQPLAGDGRQRWAGSATDIDDRRRAEAALRLLADASAALGGGGGTAALTAVARLASAGFCDWCAILLCEGSALAPAALAHRDPAAAEALRMQFARPRSGGAATGPAAVLRSGRPELLPEAPETLRVALGADDGLPRVIGPRSWLAVPITVRGATAGVLAFAICSGERRFTAADLAVGEDLARRVAAALAADAAAVEERCRAREIRSLEARFRRLVEANLFGVAFCTFSGGVTWANDRFLAMVGYSRADLEAGTVRWDAMTPPEWQASDRAAQAQMLAAGLAEPYEKEYVRKDGTRVPVLVGGVRLGEPFDPREDIVCFYVDLSDRRRVETALAQQAAELERSNAELERFAYVASHDLQEPLRMVTNFLGLLTLRHGQVLPAAARGYIDFAVDGALRMQTLVNDLLAYSRAGRKPATTPVPAAQALGEAVAILRHAIEETDAVIEHGDLPVLLLAKAEAVQLFQNLVGNALKFHGPRPPRVHVAAHRVDGGWEIAVADNGIGMDPAHGERIFELFQRLHTRSEYPGTGIGLAICRRIVERHGGRIRVESRPGDGATFRIVLPDGVALPPP